MFVYPLSVLDDAYWKLVVLYNKWWGPLAIFAIIITIAWLAYMWSQRHERRRTR